VSVQSLDGSSGGIRVGCLKVARMPLACELAERPELWHRPVVVAHPDTAKVWSASPAAVAEGIREGQPLSEAKGRCPPLVLLDARPARYEEHNEAMLAALERVAPGVEPDGLGVAYVDLSGLIRSYRGPQALYTALLACAPDQLRPRLGVAPTKFVALLAASAVRQGETTPVNVVGSADVAAFMAPIAVEALPVSPEAIRRLRLVGITTIGQLARLPRHALVAQFGPEGIRLAGLLDGTDEPVRPRSHPERLGERLQLTDPLASRPAVLAAADRVLERVLRHPRRRDRVARQVLVRTETEQGKRWESAITLREPRGDRDGIWVALAPVLERAPLPGPVSQLSIELRELGPPRGRQGQLLASAHTDRAQRRQQVEESLRQLRSRYGRTPVGRMTPVEPQSRVPERRWALIEED
jgi:protein ImuB